MDLIIEGHPAELEWLRREIEKNVGSEAQLEAVPSRDAEELREPIIVAIIVSLGGPAIVKAIRDVVKSRHRHVEEMERISNELRVAEMDHEFALTELRMRTSDGGTDTVVTEDQI